MLALAGHARNTIIARQMPAKIDFSLIRRVFNKIDVCVALKYYKIHHPFVLQTGLPNHPVHEARLGLIRTWAAGLHQKKQTGRLVSEAARKKSSRLGCPKSLIGGSRRGQRGRELVQTLHDAGKGIPNTNRLDFDAVQTRLHGGNAVRR